MGFHARAELLPALLNSLENLGVRQLKRERLVQPHLRYRYDMILCQEQKVSPTFTRGRKHASIPCHISSAASPSTINCFFSFSLQYPCISPLYVHEPTRQIGSSLHVSFLPCNPTYNSLQTPPPQFTTVVWFPPQRKASTGAIILAEP
jgi:hypothetical protein